ncbi:bifunctional riboflavin kinase/FAD synthetase [Croceicoccus marinus]|jgi:riboflavin kinase/FMN adenylyltransferase|uniref:Riboflavin biosynthesis protein n=1 Tax=Croceicoccus marinus TaxID=450378 RepID=A0A7G6VUV9_9SPHN|nr:bifunctional riboflavin kinase/FAD synthetase [Croceicoccus marinus]QNE05524.1 bifunctional riboflavin kinase/FAD synthetase [Croceicoccus marinus]
MIRLSATDPMPDKLRGAVIALGNFDGVHRGHQQVIAQARALAQDRGAPLIVATFDPHPVRYFAPDLSPFRLTSLDQRQELFAGLGAAAMLVFQFDHALATTSAEDFIDDVLADRLAAGGVVTGHDFTFGKGRRGNVAMLRERCEGLGIAVRIVAPVEDGGDVVSSTRVRNALAAGDPREAARLLTRPFAIRGEVVHGAKLGRSIGFPTANLLMGSYLRPRFGIYAITGRVLTGALAGGPVMTGAANLGVRPSFDPPTELLEPYFFDFRGNLYGQTIEVALHHFIRPEEKYETLEALKDQIARDCDEARRFLAGREG